VWLLDVDICYLKTLALIESGFGRLTTFLKNSLAQQAKGMMKQIA